MERITRFFSTKKAEKTGDRTFKFIISDETKDRHGTVIKMDGWDVQNYSQNPIVAYQHDTFMSDPDMILGKALKVWVEDKKLMAEAEFMPIGMNATADKVVNHLEFGSLRSVSVGFIPKKWSLGIETDGEDKNTLYFREQELLEFSVVHIPSNPNAVMSKSLDDFLKKAFEVKSEDETQKNTDQEEKSTDTEEKTTETKQLDECTTHYLRSLL